MFAMLLCLHIRSYVYYVTMSSKNYYVLNYYVSTQKATADAAATLSESTPRAIGMRTT